MHIGLLIGQLGQGGAERQIYLISTALQKLDALSFVLTFNADGVWRKPLEQAGIQIIAISRRGSIDFSRLILLRKVLKTQEIDILFCFGSAESSYGRLAGINLSVNVVPNLRNQDWGSRRDLWVDKLLSPLTTNYVANSYAGSRYLKEIVGISGKKIHLIPNAIDTETTVGTTDQQFDPRPPGDHSNEIWCGWVGSFNQRKDPSLLLEIATITRLKTPQLHYLVVGEGPDREKVGKIAREKGLLSNMHFTGEIENASGIWKYLDFGLSTSRVEGTPNVLLEAMVWGKPYVAPPVGDIPHWINNGDNGLISQTRSPEELAELVINIANDPTRRDHLGAGALQASRKFLTPLEAGRLYLELSEKLVANQQSRHPDQKEARHTT